MQIQTPEDWQALKDRCQQEGKRLFLAKLSPACPVSHMAEKIIEEWLPGKTEGDFIPARIDVIRARNLSRAIASEVGVVHQSPQVILFTPEVEPMWDADHFDITAEALDQRVLS